VLQADSANRAGQCARAAQSLRRVRGARQPGACRSVPPSHTASRTSRGVRFSAPQDSAGAVGQTDGAGGDGAAGAPGPRLRGLYLGAALSHRGKRNKICHRGYDLVVLGAVRKTNDV